MASKFNVTAAAEGVGVGPGGLVSVVNRGIQEGWSQRQTISVARELGLHFANQTFRNLYNEQSALYARREAVMSHPPDTPFGPEHVTQTTWGKPGVYYHWITIVRREVGTGELVTDTSVRWGDELRSADDVVSDLMDDIDQHAEEYGGQMVTLGAFVYDVTQGI